jgi:transposase InsO family protein
MLAWARKILFWPNMQSDVEKLAVTCGICALHRPSQARELLQPQEMPRAPGEVIAAAFFQICTQHFLAIYDVFSQFPFLWPVRSKSTAKLVRSCRAFFQFTGCPRAFWCDQGSAFDSNEFHAFADSIGMRVYYSSAEYPQSNGAAESVVKILKRLRQVSLNKNELFRVLLYLQNSAKRKHAAAPAEIFLGRSLRTPLQPQSNQSFVLWRDHHTERTSEQLTMKAQYNPCATRTANDYQQGDRILVHNVCGITAQATVVEQTDRRTYLVEYQNGSRSIRNRRFLTFIPSSSNSGLPTAPRPRSDTTTPGGSSTAAPEVVDSRSPRLVKTSP